MLFINIFNFIILKQSFLYKLDTFPYNLTNFKRQYPIIHLFFIHVYSSSKCIFSKSPYPAVCLNPKGLLWLSQPITLAVLTRHLKILSFHFADTSCSLFSFFSPISLYLPSTPSHFLDLQPQHYGKILKDCPTFHFKKPFSAKT